MVTGVAGFIGSELIRRIIFDTKHHVLNLDKLTYAGNLESLNEVSSNHRYQFENIDICNQEAINYIFKKYKPNAVMHLAAESHVDKSIDGPVDFMKTNIMGTMVLLNAFKTLWQNNWKKKRFYHISTDEVYGTLGETGLFKETTPYDPNSPYSASKASSDHFVRAYGETYGMPYVITNCSNNYGENHFPEKLIPLFINNIIKNNN